MLQARDVMTGTVAPFSPLDSAQVARLLQASNIGDVLILEKERVVGILTGRDIALLLMPKGVDPNRESMRDVMSGRARLV